MKTLSEIVNDQLLPVSPQHKGVGASPAFRAEMARRKSAMRDKGQKKATASRCKGCRVDGEIYASITDAANDHGVSLTAVIYRLGSPNFPGWVRL